MVEPFMLIRSHSWEVKSKPISELKAGREGTLAVIIAPVCEVVPFLPQTPDSKPSEAPWRGVSLM